MYILIYIHNIYLINFILFTILCYWKYNEDIFYTKTKIHI